MILETFYLMIPAYFANMAPPLLAKYFPHVPMDFGLSLNNKRILGDHKTWNGFLCGVVVAVLVGLLLSKIYWPFDFSALLWSFLVGFGALFGDAFKSFFKRRFDFAPGRSWIPFDQIDYTVGAFVFGSFIFFPGWLNSFVVVFVSAFGHVAVNHIGFWLGLRDVKW